MITNELGKMPPQAIDLEEAILGAIMLEKHAMQSVVDILSPESFYKEHHEWIYEACLTLFKCSYPIDILTVTQELKRTKKLELLGGAYTITILTNRVASADNIEFHARIIQEKYILRKIIEIGTTAVHNGYNDGSDCFEVIGQLEKGLTSLNKFMTVGRVQTIGGLWNKIAEKNELLLTQKGINGVPSGYEVLDKLTGGWQSPDLIIVAARPAMGKTSLALNFARNAAVDFKMAGVVFSLEMDAIQIATRLFSMESDTPISHLSRRGVEAERLQAIGDSCSKVINSEIYIDDTAGITLTELRSKARKLKREKNIQWIFIDYLQLMSGDRTNKRGNREQEISEISRGLKSLAKELEVPVIALSQLSRANEQRGGEKRPQLSDLRESGAIEQDADIVMFIHRPEYYGINEYDTGESTNGIAEIIFAKHRNGATGTEKLRFINYLTKFVPLESETPLGLEPNYEF